MTDPANAIDQAERIRRLQERRAASGRPPRDAAPRAELQGGEGGALPAAAPRRPRPRRRHPAAATRWLLGGLSVASFFTIAGTVAVANLGSGTAAQPTPPAAQVAAAPVVAAPVVAAPVAAAPPPSVSAPSVAAPAAIPRPTASAAPVAPAPAPHTTTRGS